MMQVSVTQVQAAQAQNFWLLSQNIQLWQGKHRHLFSTSQRLTATNFPPVIRKLRALSHQHSGNWTRSWCRTLCPSGNVVFVLDFVCDKLCILLGFNMALQLIGVTLWYCQIQRYHNLEKQNKCLQQLI